MTDAPACVSHLLRVHTWVRLWAAVHGVLGTSLHGTREARGSLRCAGAPGRSRYLSGQRPMLAGGTQCSRARGSSHGYLPRSGALAAHVLACARSGRASARRLPSCPETPHAKTLVEDTRGGGGHLEQLHSRGRHVANRRFPKPIARDLPCSSVRSEDTTTEARRKLAEAWMGRAIRSCTGSRRGRSSWTGSSRACSSWTGSSKRGHSSWTGSSRGHSSRTGSRMTHSLKGSSTVCSSWTGSSHRSHRNHSPHRSHSPPWSPHTSHSPPWSPHMSHSPPWSPHRSHSPPWSPHRSHSWSRNRLAHSSTRACSSRRGHSSRSRSPHSRSRSPRSQSRSPHSWSHSPHSRSRSPRNSRSRSPRNSHSSPWFWWVEGGADKAWGPCVEFSPKLGCARESWALNRGGRGGQLEREAPRLVERRWAGCL
ncbi:serine/arginine repetitive matrix protein 2-like [Lontra canadensis]|uniref:serine/arginine repetitive matrix protein 2-like n=1 Tax=Lontra canadensis TaxID=76717 RepID=UPI0013F302FF|nr:serine/arginine repetitive matrix protein 2-like [Lontra canadensis]